MLISSSDVYKHNFISLSRQSKLLEYSMKCCREVTRSTFSGVDRKLGDKIMDMEHFLAGRHDLRSIVYSTKVIEKSKSTPE